MATPTSLPASFTSSTLASATMNNLRGAFRVLQVLSVTTGTQTTSTSSTLVDLSGLSVTITPQSTSNKILLVAANQFRASGGAMDIEIGLVRGATVVFRSVQGFLQNTDGISASSIFLDSPNTTSATTYKVQGARNFGAGTAIFNASSCNSTFLVCEISA